jgi:hypothetical protein
MRVKCLKYHKFRGEREEGVIYNIPDTDAKKLIANGYYEEFIDKHYAVKDEEEPVKNKMVSSAKKKKKR